MKIFIKKSLKDSTSFGIGGLADCFVEPKNIKELVSLIKYLRTANIIYYILGNGTNVLVSDKGVHGCVVHIGENLSNIRVKDNVIEAEAGALISDIAKTALNHNLTGFEELSGIPGTIGGAVAMNAGAYGKEMRDVVASVNAIVDTGRVSKLTKEKLAFTYRSSSIQTKNYIATSIVINLQPDKKENILSKMKKYRELREKNQPLEYRSAGSTFKRPEGGFASKLIQDSNLKGERIGDAMVSEKHAGFIVNIGKATSSDIYKLIQKVKQTVKVYFDIELEPEIKFWGKF